MSLATDEEEDERLAQLCKRINGVGLETRISVPSWPFESGGEGMAEERYN